MDKSWIIHKFGGTSVAHAERIKRVVRLVANGPGDQRKIVVVSALGGVTDQLIRAVSLAQERNVACHAELESIARRHEAVLQDLISPANRDTIRAKLERLWHDLAELLDGIFLLRECTLRTRDALIGMGERASVHLVAGAFREAGYKAKAHEATEFIRTDERFGSAEVQFPVTQQLVRSYFDPIAETEISVVTGFIASTEQGVYTTLGRSGSDYTATILAWALDADEVIIWTDVDGVLTADPRLVDDAFSLPQLSYEEASEMAYFGAKVLHPRTMRPLQEKQIPLITKNTLNPDAQGTRISSESDIRAGRVKAVTAIREMALLTLEGTGMMGVPGVAARACRTLADADINILMITQASSEQNLCFVVQQTDGKRAVDLLRLEFGRELEKGDIARIDAKVPVAVTAVVGDNMRHHPGIAGQMLSSLGKSHVNVLAIAQGSSERNISVVVDQPDASGAVRALHETFAMNRKVVNLIFIGVGNVGKVLLNQLAVQAPVFNKKLGLNLRLVGISRSSAGVFDASGISFEEATQRVNDGKPLDLASMAEKVKSFRLENVIVVDLTASTKICSEYDQLLEAGLSVVTANKLGNAAAMVEYKKLMSTRRPNRVAYRYETTVGAGLPVVSTLQDLVKSGDSVHRIEGVLSGTLAFVCNAMMDGMKFSEAVTSAREKGYTEPDPREDLAGEDVVRKMLILAREAGLEIERTDVDVTPLADIGTAGTDVASFMDSLKDQDDAWEKRVSENRRANRRLQYVGVMENQRLTVSLQDVGPESPLFALTGTDNLVAFATDRYSPNPLVIRGPGAGPTVTAAGVLADILKVAEFIT